MTAKATLIVEKSVFRGGTVDEDDPESDVEDDTGQQSDDEALGLENLTLGSATTKSKRAAGKLPSQPATAKRPTAKKPRVKSSETKKRERVVEDGLLKYVNTATCRRKVCDEYFNNPPRDTCEAETTAFRFADC